MTNAKITPVILCGGSGTRLWPLSRKSFPKQFVPLVDNKSLLQLTLERVVQVNNDRTAQEVICVAAEDHRFLVSEDTHLKVLRLLEHNPHMSQRELAQALGVSLGKTNFCIRALLQKGLIKLANFQSNRHKLAYSYLLTPSGISEKSAITARFLKRKMAEYERLQLEIAALQLEVNGEQIDVKP